MSTQQSKAALWDEWNSQIFPDITADETPDPVAMIYDSESELGDAFSCSEMSQTGSNSRTPFGGEPTQRLLHAPALMCISSER